MFTDREYYTNTTMIKKVDDKIWTKMNKEKIPT